MLTPSRGDLLINGLLVEEIKPASHYDAMSAVFQNPARYQTFTVADNVWLGDTTRERTNGAVASSLAAAARMRFTSPSVGAWGRWTAAPPSSTCTARAASAVIPKMATRDYPAAGHGPQGDVQRVFNYVRLVRDAETPVVDEIHLYLPMVLREFTSQ